MKLYYSQGACSLVVRIAIEELHLKAEYEAVNLATKKTETGLDFLTINPKGSVPALLLDNGQVLTENVAILQYIADSVTATSLLAPVKTMERYRTLEWLNYLTTDVHKTFSSLFSAQVPKEVKDTVFSPMLCKKFDFMDQRLSENKYLCGDTFTLADIYLYVVTRWLRPVHLNLEQWSNVTRFFQEVKLRASVVNALEQEKMKK